MARLTGKNIGGYEFLSVIGTGGFSTVYLARDRAGEEYAVKVLAENHAFDADIRERFISEADALRRVRSDLIMEVFDLGETAEGQPFIVMQHADRGDLVQRRRTLIGKGWKPLAIDVQFLTDVIADAVEAVHVKNLVHRDVSPSNILIYSGKRNLYRSGIPFLRADESLLLADFGLVKDMSQGSGLTVGAGTPGFAAPEQRTGLSLIDHRIDIYAASAVVLWFLTGATVSTLPDWRDRLAEDDLPVSLLSAIDRGLSPLPEDRHQSIDEWHEDITANLSFLDNPADDGVEQVDSPAIASRKPSASVDRPETSKSSAVERPTSRSKTFALAGAAAALLLLGVVGLSVVSGVFSSPSEVTDAANAETELGSTTTVDPDSTATGAAVDSDADDSNSSSVSESGSESETETPSDSEEENTVVSIPAEEETADTVPPPEMETYFEFDQGRVTLDIVWSKTQEPPATAIGRDIEVAINDGLFETEWRTDNFDEPGWSFFNTGLNDVPVTRANNYRIRTRWILVGGETSEWSEVQTVVADP